MSLIEALHIHLDKIFVELARAERHYIGNVSPYPPKHSKIHVDASKECSSPYCDGLCSRVDLGNYGLLIAARSEISSIQFSLSSKS
jgi:hypothetical protein